MKFEETAIVGAYLIRPEELNDERGFFARTYCHKEFEKHGLNPKLVQCNISFNHTKGTLRGLHFQMPPHAEVKVVRCTHGSIYDVILDLRKESPTYLRSIGIELTAENRLALYMPERVAHGFVTLKDESEVFYQMSSYYEASSASGVRWNDPIIDIQWPKMKTEYIISNRDKNFPNYRP